MPLPYGKPPGAKLTAFRQSDHPLRALVGPIFGGRKSACFNDILGRAVDRRYRRQLHWRWVVVRPLKNELEAYTIPCVTGWLGGEGQFDAKARRLDFAFELGDGCERLIEINFLAMSEAADRRRLPMFEATAVWLDDARRLDEGVLDDCIGIAGSYPSLLAGGAAWSGIICSSRMPAPGHWLVSRDGLELHRQPSGLGLDAENVEHLAKRGFSYARTAQENEWRPDWVRIHVEAELASDSAEAAQEVVRIGAREGLREFIHLIAPEHAPDARVQAKHHDLLIDKLEAVARGEIKRLMFFLPPGSAKSTYASILFAAWYVGRHPGKPVIAASHTKDLAERFGRRVRNIVGSPIFRDIFGYGLSGDSGAAGRWETARGTEYTAVGVDGSVTGRRAALAIIDDPVKGRNQADSASEREHAWNWYKSDLWTRLLPDGAIIYIATRWHDDDLAGRLLEEAKKGGEPWDVVSIPAIAKENDPLGRAVGERLWPEWFTDEMFATAQRDTRNWSALYQQEPMPESGDFFRLDWFKWYDNPPPREQMRVYGASDYAVKANAGDYTVHLVVGVDPYADIYVLDLWRDRTASDRWVEALLDLAKQHRPLDWAEEKGQIEKGVGPFLDRRMRERNIWFHRRQYPAVGDKATRAQSIRARAAQGRIHLPRSAPWIADFLQELLRFPAGIHDDQVDSFGLIGLMLDIIAPGSKPRIVATEAPPLRVEFFLEAERDLFGDVRVVERVRISTPGAVTPTILVKNVDAGIIARWPEEYAKFKASAPEPVVSPVPLRSPVGPLLLGAEPGADPPQSLRLRVPGFVPEGGDDGMTDVGETRRGGRHDPYHKSWRI